MRRFSAQADGIAIYIGITRLVGGTLDSNIVHKHSFHQSSYPVVIRKGK